MKKTERQEQLLLEQLGHRHTLTLAEAKTLLGVSESTARRLFIRLESSGAAVRRYGGIQLLQESPAADYLYEQVEGQYAAQKRQIGRCAAEMIESGDVLYLDSGTTMACAGAPAKASSSISPRAEGSVSVAIPLRLKLLPQSLQTEFTAWWMFTTGITQLSFSTSVYFSPSFTKNALQALQV